MSTGATALPARTDVVVVGAGPTGLALACGLAARGVEPLVLDRVAQGANTSRAAVVHARTLEVLEDIDVTGHLLRLGGDSAAFGGRGGRGSPAPLAGQAGGARSVRRRPSVRRGAARC